MQSIHEIYADIAELEKAFGTDKTSPNRLKGIMEQLGDKSLLAIGTVVPPIRQDEESEKQPKEEE